MHAHQSLPDAYTSRMPASLRRCRATSTSNRPGLLLAYHCVPTVQIESMERPLPLNSWCQPVGRTRQHQQQPVHETTAVIISGPSDMQQELSLNGILTLAQLLQHC